MDIPAKNPTLTSNQSQRYTMYKDNKVNHLPKERREKLKKNDPKFGHN